MLQTDAQHPFKKAWSRNLKSRVKWFFYGISKRASGVFVLPTTLYDNSPKSFLRLSHSATFTLTFLEVRVKLVLPFNVHASVFLHGDFSPFHSQVTSGKAHIAPCA